ncbi:hypothetical protein LEMLEM_LOCUS13434, partial [Lemmus lemmus]
MFVFSKGLKSTQDLRRNISKALRMAPLAFSVQHGASPEHRLGSKAITTPKAQYRTFGSTHRQKDVPLKEMQACSWGGFKNKRIYETSINKRH